MAWRVAETQSGLRLSFVRVRSPGSEAFTWAELLHRRLSAVRVYVLYFPSRFDLTLDGTVKAALETFGRQTGPDTSVNAWDPTDPEFTTALSFFDLKAPPALVLTTGHNRDSNGVASDAANLYSIALTDPGALGDRERLAAAVNSVHEVLMRGDRRAIAQFVKDRDRDRLLDALARIAEGIRDQLVKCKPTFGLPGGVSLRLGG